MLRTIWEEFIGAVDLVFLGALIGAGLVLGAAIGAKAMSLVGAALSVVGVAA